MSRRPALEAVGLSKVHAGTTVLHGIDFSVRTGTLTGFLGPNGAGKSTTLRLLAGLDRPTTGEALVRGRPLGAWAEPSRVAGFALGGRCAHPGRTARDSVRWAGRLAGVSRSRCDEAVEQVGLGAVAGRRTRGFSLGMRQRLSLAIALVADPGVVVLDEPMNGLDPEGLRWTRELLTSLRDEGRTVFFTTHLLREVEDLVDDLVVLDAGRVVAAEPLTTFVARCPGTAVSAATADPRALAAVLERAGGAVRPAGDGRLRVTGLDGPAVAAAAAASGHLLTELRVESGLRQAYDHATSTVAARPGAPGPAPATVPAGSGRHRRSPAGTGSLEGSTR